MQDFSGFLESMFTADSETITQKALAVFRYQAENNAVYRRFLQYLDIAPAQVTQLTDIPFLPISVFKQHKVVSGSVDPDLVFTSSGTTGMQVSSHFVADPALYVTSYLEGFRRVYGDPSGYCILALLPSYLERSGSSLVYMCQGLIERSGHPKSGFYLHDMAQLALVLAELREKGTPTLLIGVSFALLDLGEGFPMHFPELLVMETGGMKGRREELTREALHSALCRAFGTTSIHSEYGMTELLSQAYSTGNGLFASPPWMRIFIRDPEDPMSQMGVGKTGCINVMDLANVHSCSFIATDDLGKVHADGRFEVLGRFDASDVRGCNLLVQ